jgi:large subunit ribosomal protein L11
MEQVIEVVVEGGKATAAPPLGPALGPLGVNIQEVVDKINEDTRDMEGVKVPVKVIVDTATKEYRIEVGKPPASSLILKELSIEKGSATPGQSRVGDLTNGQVRKIAKAKFGSDDDSSFKQIKGTARSMGITVGEGEVSEEELEEAERLKEEAMAEEEKPAEGEVPAEGEEGAEVPEEGEAPAVGEEKPEGEAEKGGEPPGEMKPKEKGGKEKKG